MPFDTTCKNTEEVEITCTPMTGGPNPRPAPVDGPLRVSVVSGDGSVGPQDPATPMVFVVRSGDAAGVTEFKVEADSDTTVDGEVLIFDTVNLTVTSEQAATLGFSAGAPRPKTA